MYSLHEKLNTIILPMLPFTTIDKVSWLKDKDANIDSVTSGWEGLYLYDQRHAKRDFQTYAKSEDPDQSTRLRRRVWSGSALFDTRHING